MTSQAEIRKRVTDEIVAALKAGTTRLPWSRPWTEAETGLPTNAVSGKTYQGINVLLLMLVGQARGYTSKYWATFNQWRDLGFQVKKRPDNIPAGQYGTRCILYKPVTKTTKTDDGDDEEHRYFLLREFVLFSAEAVCGPGIEDYLAKPQTSNGFVDYQPAEDAIAATGADVRHGSNRAVYRIEEDCILLPVKGAFSKPHEYYGTALHELCHWSGHESRLNRLVKLAKFGSASYGMEELVAEIGSAFLCAQLNIPNSDDRSNVTAYLSSWLDVLQRDHNAIFTASSAASKAADYILGFSRPQVDTEADSEAVAQRAAS